MTCCPEGTHERIASRKTGTGETGFFFFGVKHRQRGVENESNNKAFC